MSGSRRISSLQGPYPLSGLEEDSDYSITLTANTAAGSIHSNQTSATTSTAGMKKTMLLSCCQCNNYHAAPNGGPSFVSFDTTNINVTSITVQWQAIPCSERNRLITGYTVQYSSTRPVHNNTVTVSGADSRTLVVSDLLPRTSYTFSVRAQGAAVSSATNRTTSTATPAG